MLSETIENRDGQAQTPTHASEPPARGHEPGTTRALLGGRMRAFILKLQGVWEILRYFGNPLMVIAMRLGLLRLPLFLYRISIESRRYAMLARPNATSMADLFVLREVLVGETYRDVLPLLNSGPLRVVDVGGNLGSFTVWLHRRHGLREGYCFEPDPNSFNLCRYNLSNNDCQCVQLFPKAAGGLARQIQMRTNTQRPGSQSIYKATAASPDSVPVDVVAFPDWLRSIAGNFDVLKLDCEGAEWEILDHTPPELWQRFSVIVAEIHGDPGGRHALEEFPDGLAKMGFKTVRWDGYAQGLYIGRRLTAS